MSDVTVVGLGNMGSALAKAVLNGGHSVTAWNRSSRKVDAIVAMGADPAATLMRAVSASPVTLICVADYRISRSLLTSEDMLPLLTGRTVIQLSTGSPQEAQELGDLCQSRGAMYIDGAILGLPRDVGTRSGQVLFSGSEVAFRKVQPILDALGGDILYLGENVRAAATLDLAWLCQRLGMILGALHGALVCEAEAIGIDDYGAMFKKDDRAHILLNTIHNDGYDKPDATVEVWNSVTNRILKHARTQNINDAFPVFCADLFSKAVDKGLADEDVAALIKVLRQR